MAERLKKIVQVTERQSREFKIVCVSRSDLELLTNIFLLELSGEMSLDKGGFTSASISYQDKLQEIIQLTLVPTGLSRYRKTTFQSTQLALGVTHPSTWYDCI